MQHSAWSINKYVNELHVSIELLGSINWIIKGIIIGSVISVFFVFFFSMCHGYHEYNKNGSLHFSKHSSIIESIFCYHAEVPTSDRWKGMTYLIISSVGTFHILMSFLSL